MILVVDDFADGRTTLCHLIKSWGYPCQGASNGPEALAFLRSHPTEEPVLVMLDVMMPEMNGVEVLQKIRSDPKIAHTTVVMYSAGFDDAQENEAIALGAVKWVLKGAIEGIEEICQYYDRVAGPAIKPS